MKFPTMDEFAKSVAEKALDEIEYNGKTIREWIEIILATDNNVGTKLSTNLAEVGTDCISRRQAIAAIDECYCGGEDSCGEPWIYKENAVEAINMIEPLSSAEPKRGKWIYQNGMINCDQCLRAIRRIDHDGLLNFCPNCGADMRGEQDG